LNFLKVFGALGLVVMLAGAVRGDSLPDGHIVVGGGNGSSNSCNSFQGTTSVNGSIDTDCFVPPGELATTITFAILDANTDGGLTVTSALTTIFPTTGPEAWLDFLNWTETGNCFGASSANIGGIDSCTLTAPTMPTGQLFNQVEQALTNLGLINNGECISPWDFIFGIPGAGVDGNSPTKGCDILFNTPSDNSQNFADNVQYDISPNGTPLASLTPEPGVLCMLLIGLAGLALARRKFAAQSLN
jgi:hypothetical protein